jgi:hypothetical protein
LGDRFAQNAFRTKGSRSVHNGRLIAAFSQGLEIPPTILAHAEVIE